MSDSLRRVGLPPAPKRADGFYRSPEWQELRAAVHRAAGTLPKLLWQHRADEPIGVYSAVTEDAVGQTRLAETDVA